MSDAQIADPAKDEEKKEEAGEGEGEKEKGELSEESLDKVSGGAWYSDITKAILPSCDCDSGGGGGGVRG